jgi:hypothetical protein
MFLGRRRRAVERASARPNGAIADMSRFPCWCCAPRSVRVTKHEVLVASRRADRLYKWLAELPSPDAELILAVGLQRAEPAYFDKIVHLLFERGSDAAWAGLISNYPLLKPELRARLRADPQRMRSGLVRVLRGGSPQGRCNALEALRDTPEPALAYLLPDLLRASSSDVRRAAAVTLRCLAEMVVDGAAESQSDKRVDVVRAVWEALRGFDSHYRLEVVECALWFTHDLGRDLWAVLANRRSPTAHVVSANLNSWDSPRLARFLLEALTQPAWRIAARDLLTRWQGADRLTTILRNSDLLRHPEFRDSLNSLRRPAWFAGLHDLRELPKELWVQAPEWLVLLGLRPEDKLTLLANWSDTAFADLRTAVEKAVRTVAVQQDSSTAEPVAQTLPGVSRRSPEQSQPARVIATAGTDEPPAAAFAASHVLDRQAAAVREQAQAALQRLTQCGPDQTTADQIAALEETLHRLRAELSAASPPPPEWENPA